MPRSLTFLLSAIWIIVMTFGFYQVYLFINGYPLFTVAKKETQKGYINFESDIDASFFLNNEYVGTKKMHDLYPVGQYRMCAEKLGYADRCFPESVVNTNDKEMLHYNGIVLFPDAMTPRLVTEEKVYLLPSKKGFFWYDTDKKQIFWIDKKSADLQSFYPSFVPDEVVWDDEKKQYFLVKKKIKTPLSFPSFHFELPKSIELYAPLSVHLWGIEQNKTPKTIAGEQIKKMLVSFSSEWEESFSFGSSFSQVLIFPHHVLLYSLNGNDLRHLFTKDPKTPVLYFEKSKQFWFQKDGKLYVLQM